MQCFRICLPPGGVRVSDRMQPGCKICSARNIECIEEIRYASPLIHEPSPQFSLTMPMLPPGFFGNCFEHQHTIVVFHFVEVAGHKQRGSCFNHWRMRYIGSHTTWELLKQGHSVTSAMRFWQY